jgi:hypothetical protein
MERTDRKVLAMTLDRVPFSLVPIEIAFDKRLSLTHIRVLIALLSFRTRETDVIFPKRETLAIRCGLPLCKISTATTDLVGLGWLEKHGSGGRSSPTQYKVKVPREITDALIRALFDSETVTESVTVNQKTVTESVTVNQKTVTESELNGYRFGNLTVTDSVTGKEETKKKPRRNQEKKLTSFVSSAETKKIEFDGTQFLHITPGLRDAWQRAYPALSLDAELARAAAWLIANPKNKKSNYARFLTGWLSRAQDRAPRVAAISNASTARTEPKTRARDFLA